MTPTMRAAVLHGQADVRVESVALRPPGPGEVLVRVKAALTCGTDVKVYRRGYHARMITPPAIFGHEVAGVVEAAGDGVSDWPPGTPVVAANSAPCGRCGFCRAGRESLCDDLLFWNGAYAEFALIPARIVGRNLLRLPAGLPFSHAASAEPLACAVRGVEVAGVAAGQPVAVIGAGPIGLMLVALCRLAGARVVAAGRRPERLAAALALGAQAAVSAGPDADLGARLRAASPEAGGFDVVIEASGSVAGSEAAIAAVRKGGRVNLFAGCPADARVGLDVARLHYEELTLTSSFHHDPRAFREALRLIAERRVDPAAWITAEAPLAELPDVLRDLAEGAGGLKTAIVPG